MCKCFGSITVLETNQRPGFQLTYVSKTLMLPKHLHMIQPLVRVPLSAVILKEASSWSAELICVHKVFLSLQGPIICEQNQNCSIKLQQISKLHICPHFYPQ